jgi:hypothetical protein
MSTHQLGNPARRLSMQNLAINGVQNLSCLQQARILGRPTWKHFCDGVRPELVVDGDTEEIVNKRHVCGRHKT